MPGGWQIRGALRHGPVAFSVPVVVVGAALIRVAPQEHPMDLAFRTGS